jgi:hypothetical protein
MKLRIKLAALAMAGSAAALVLAATPAMASSHAITGPEIAWVPFTARRRQRTIRSFR